MTKARDIASAIPATSTVDATELGYLDGVSSAIQTQLDAKTAKSTLTTTGDIYYASAANTPARLAIGSTSNVLTVAGGIPSWAAPAGGSFVGCIATRTSSTQSISSATATAITLPTEQIDTNTFHDTSTNTSRFTIPSGKDGLYLIQALAEFNQSAGTYAYFEVFLNGLVYTSNGYNDGRFAYGPSGSNQLYGSTIMDLDATDYLEIALLSQAGCDIAKARISISYLGA